MISILKTNTNFYKKIKAEKFSYVFFVGIVSGVLGRGEFNLSISLGTEDVELLSAVSSVSLL